MCLAMMPTGILQCFEEWHKTWDWLMFKGNIAVMSEGSEGLLEGSEVLSHVFCYSTSMNNFVLPQQHVATYLQQISDFMYLSGTISSVLPCRVLDRLQNGHLYIVSYPTTY